MRREKDQTRSSWDGTGGLGWARWSGGCSCWPLAGPAGALRWVAVGSGAASPAVAFAFRARRVSASALGNARGRTPMTKRPPTEPVPRFANGFYFSAPQRAHPCVLRPASCILRPASCVLHPASCILRPSTTTAPARPPQLAGHPTYPLFPPRNQDPVHPASSP